MISGMISGISMMDDEYFGDRFCEPRYPTAIHHPSAVAEVEGTVAANLEIRGASLGKNGLFNGCFGWKIHGITLSFSQRFQVQELGTGICIPTGAASGS